MFAPLRTAFKKLFGSKQNNKMLGRWSHLNRKEDIDKRIYLANMDHCGCCDIK